MSREFSQGHVRLGSFSRDPAVVKVRLTEGSDLLSCAVHMPTAGRFGRTATVILVLASFYPKRVSGCWGGRARRRVDGRGAR